MAKIRIALVVVVLWSGSVDVVRLRADAEGMDEHARDRT